MVRTAVSILLLSIAVAPKPAAAQAHPGAVHRHPSGAKIIMYGTIVDPSCRFAQGLSGAAHAQCAAACADRGVSLVLLGADGQMYLLTEPGRPAGSANSRVKSLVERETKVMGTVYQAGGAYLIAVDSVAAASP